MQALTRELGEIQRQVRSMSTELVDIWGDGDPPPPSPPQIRWSAQEQSNSLLVELTNPELQTSRALLSQLTHVVDELQSSKALISQQALEVSSLRNLLQSLDLF